MKLQKYRIKSLCDNKIGETQKTIIEQNQLTRDAINQLKIDELADKLGLARSQISNLEQSQYILSALGSYYQKPAVNPCGCFNSYYGYPGTTVV